MVLTIWSSRVQGSNCVLVSPGMAVNSGSDTGVRMSPIQISEHMKQVSSFRPSSVPLNLDITAVRGFDQCDGGSELGEGEFVSFVCSRGNFKFMKI